MSHFTDLADIFEKMADAMEAEPPAAAPAEKVAAAAPAKPVSKLAALVHTATGDELPPELVARIENDSALLETVTKLAEHGARPTPLGDAVSRGGSPSAVTRSEKIAEAWEGWNNVTLGNGSRNRME